MVLAQNIAGVTALVPADVTILALAASEPEHVVIIAPSAGKQGRPARNALVELQTGAADGHDRTQEKSQVRLEAVQVTY